MLREEVLLGAFGWGTLPTVYLACGSVTNLVLLFCCGLCFLSLHVVFIALGGLVGLILRSFLGGYCYVGLRSVLFGCGGLRHIGCVCDAVDCFLICIFNIDATYCNSFFHFLFYFC